ncbi:hypothetical protein J3E68DRAFT_420552 [Trichoderma sp. SZMC 28012]
MLRIGCPHFTMDTITPVRVCFTLCAATLSCYDSKGVGHSASVALQFETDQPTRIRSCWDYCKGWSMTVSTATYLSLPGIIRPSNLGATAYSMVGRQMQCNPPKTHTAQRENQPAKA